MSSVTENKDGIEGALFETMDVISNPVLTNDTLNLLRFLGVLGGVESGLRAPSGASTKVVVYWTYTPPEK